MDKSTGILIAALLLSSIMQGQQVPTKIGSIYLQKALASTQEGQKANQSISGKVEPKQKEFNARQQEIAQMQDQLTKGANLLNDERKSQLARDIDSKKKKLERDTQDAEEALRNEQQGIVQKLTQKLMTVLSKYAKDNGYSLVLEAGDPNTSVIYSATEADITQAVVALYDKTYGTAGSTNPQPHP